MLRPEDGTFDAQSYVDLDAREKWFFQHVESPAMFARSPGAGSLYWSCARDGGGAYLDGGHSYRLSVPLPVPDKLFWSVTVYDAETARRSSPTRTWLRSAPWSNCPQTSSGTRTASTSTSGRS